MFEFALVFVEAGVADAVDEGTTEGGGAAIWREWVTPSSIGAGNSTRTLNVVGCESICIGATDDFSSFDDMSRQTRRREAEKERC